MKNKKLIIFCHHFIDFNIEYRFSLLRTFNPSWDIVSIGFEKHKQNLLNNSIIVDINQYPNNNMACEARPGSNIEWVMADTFLYETYKHLPNYDKYFLIEYDTIFNCSIEDFFPKINEYNHFGSNAFNSLNESWIFYQIYKKYNQHHLAIENCGSIGQTTCIYMDNNLLKKAVLEINNNKHLYSQMNSELRLGTIIKKINGTVMSGRDDISDYISWDRERIKLDLSKNQYFYHPVK